MSNMARTMAAEDTEVFRAVIRVHGTYKSSRFVNGQWEEYDAHTDRTQIVGPYRSTAPARAAITRAKRERAWRSGLSVEATVQRSALVWEDVE